MSHILELRNVSYEYSFQKKILNECNLKISRGKFVGIVGENGSGKTTLIELLIGYRWPDSGTVLVDDLPSNIGQNDFKKNISFVSHDIQINLKLSVSDFLEHHSFYHKSYNAKVATELLNSFQINEQKKIGELSTGQQKKVQVVAALASNTPMIIIDEVTAVLDPKSRLEVYEKLKKHNQKYNKTIILATNIIEEFEENVDEIIFIKEGKLFSQTIAEIKNAFNLRKSA